MNYLTDEAGKPIKDTNPLPISVSGRTDVISSDQDSIALGGPLAQSLARKPNGQGRLFVGKKTIPISTDASLPLEIINIHTHCIIQSFQLTTSGAVAPDIMIGRYNSSGLWEPFRLVFYNTTSGQLEYRDLFNMQNTYTIPLTSYNHGQFEITKLDSAVNVYEIKGKDGANLEFPYGFIVKANNWFSTSTYDVEVEVIYLTIP